MQHEFCAEIFAQSLFCDIVFGGAKSAGDDDHLRALAGCVERQFDVVEVVGNGYDVRHMHIVFFEFGSHPRGIGVNDLSYQQFVADVDDFAIHFMLDFV